ncbi:methyltransferase [Telmatospirillum sp.]|uniref:methyltransferase n=1 Tax=Telmatospirillum sp. TaxID=2079197 RepID=UPI00284336F1|nr:methyltransferase [Telmatospirillum sp.]MDR3437244.1 methyltransferase [Telmatospirillum sp.]
MNDNTTEDRKHRIVHAFSSRASGYDSAADVQWLVATRLAERIKATSLAPSCRVLEIGCGTGFLSQRLAETFPDGELVLTDIAASMLDRCRAKVGHRPHYQVLDGERPNGLEGQFDLIASSLAFQWFVDLEEGVRRLSAYLAPGGRMMFATLGRKTFVEWREAHEALGLVCGTPQYPGPGDFPWPAEARHAMDEELIRQPYDDGHDFVRTLKALGAGEPAPGHRPLSPGAFRRLLASLEGEFAATYHILYGDLFAGGKS